MTILDLSHWQRKRPGGAVAPLDLAAARAAGAVAVVVRQNYGLRPDDFALDHNAKADAVGLPRMVFWYLLTHQDARRQAELCWELSGRGRRRAWLDFEQSVENGDLPPAFPRYSDALFWHLVTALDRADELFGMPCGVYSRATYLDHWLTRAQQEVLARGRPLWLAQWNSVVTAPDLPLGWNAWAMWQWKIGTWPGVDGNVDQNRINPALGLDALLGRVGETVTRIKIGPHHMLGGADTERWLALSPTVAKFTDDFGAAMSARTETLTIGRRVDDGLLDNQGFDVNRVRQQRIPQAAAAWYFDVVIAPKVASDPHLRAWEGPNEQHPEDDAAHQWYAEFCYWLASYIRGAGRVPVVGSFAVGTPALDQWRHYGLLAQGVRVFGGYLALHEYGPLDGAHSLRYRAVERELAAIGYPHTPMVITECGADFVAGQTPFRGDTWRGDAARYWDELVGPYETALHADDYVLGATLFSSGDGGGAWPLFDVTGSGLIERVEARAAALASQPPAPPSGEDEMTQADRDYIREQMAAIEAARAAVVERLDALEVPPPWWEAWPEGLLSPPRKLAAPGATVTFYQTGGLAFDPPVTRFVTWQMDVFERRGDLLRVTSWTDGRANWWVRAQGVTPA